ncbi:MAG TPA: sel1 repeat family protein, partial [Alphaproteobacteria bacterium]|nr:sel1 repeat family protein [Alphaproteobacteria bacterium]
GLRDAAYELAVLYKRGEGIGRDDGEAIKWFSAAAYAGHVDAQFSMGVIYEEGQGVPVDLGRAYFWYNVAAASGHVTSESNRYRLAPELTVEQLSEVRRGLREWRDRIP